MTAAISGYKGADRYLCGPQPRRCTYPPPIRHWPVALDDSSSAHPPIENLLPRRNPVPLISHMTNKTLFRRRRAQLVRFLAAPTRVRRLNGGGRLDELEYPCQ
jgi:hypothetical protein